MSLLAVKWFEAASSKSQLAFLSIETHSLRMLEVLALQDVRWEQAWTGGRREQVVTLMFLPARFWGALETVALERCGRFGVIWVWVKNRYPKWNPGKWKHGLKPEVLCWFYVDQV